MKDRKCAKCGKPIAAGAPGCPSCLIAMAIPEKKAGSDNPTAVGSNFYAPRPEELSPLFPQLEILELLGHGGMGAVYRVRQTNLDRLVALKILSPRLNADPQFAERFTREARTLAKLTHPNIVTVFDFGQAGSHYFLLMELVEGINLRDAIETRSISPEQALAIVPQVCDALQYAHDEGVIHRDIKPENILLGKKDQVKIADFGLAKLLDPTAGDFTLTGTEQVLGTRNYMAPEQIEKSTNVDHRADIYSLGVVFYELLTGELPLGRFSLPSEKAAINGQIDQVVMRSLEKEPQRRFQQASEVKTAVQSIDRPGPATEKSSPLPQATSALPRISMPFKISDVHAGLSESLGIAHFDGWQLLLEFQTHTLNLTRSATQKVIIPAGDIMAARFKSGVFSDRVEIQTSRLEATDHIPTASQGSFKLIVKKHHTELAQRFVDSINTFEKPPQSSQDKPAVPPIKPARRSHSAQAHVPFKIHNTDHGFDEAFGIASLVGKQILLEFDVRNAMGTKKGAPRLVELPLSEVVSTRFRHGVIRDRIDIQSDRLVANVPCSTQGRVVLRTKKSDREQAEDFVEQVVIACGHGASEIAQALGPAKKAVPQSQAPPSDQTTASMLRVLLLFLGLLAAVAAGLGIIFLALSPSHTTIQPGRPSYFEETKELVEPDTESDGQSKKRSETNSTDKNDAIEKDNEAK